jgi:hypothetical protein
VPVQDLRVARLSFDAVEIRDLVLGGSGELAVDAITAVPARDGLAVSLAEVRLEGLRLAIDVSGEGPLLGSLQPALERLTAPAAAPQAEAGRVDAPPGQVGAAPFALPPVRVVDAVVVAMTPAGPMTADLTGRMMPAENGALQAEARLDLDSDLGRLRAELRGRRGSDGALHLAGEVSEGRLAWQNLSVGDFAGAVAIGRSAAGEPRVSADVGLRDLRYAPPEGAPLTLTEGRLEADADLTRAELTLALSGAGEGVDLTLQATTTPREAGRGVTLALRGEAHTQGGLARMLTLPGPALTTGTLVVQAEGEGELPPGAAEARTWRALAALLPRSRLRLAGDAILADVALADGTEGISAHLPLRAESAQQGLAVTLGDDAEFRIERPAPESLARIGVPDDLRPLVTSGLSLTLAAGGARPFRITAPAAWPLRRAALSATARARSDQGLFLAAATEGRLILDPASATAGYSGSLDLQAEAEGLSFGGREARRIAIRLPLRADYDGEGLRAALARDGELRIGQFGRAAPLRLGEPLAFTVRELELDAPPDVSGYRYRLRAEEDGAGFTVTLANSDPVPVEAGSLKLRLNGGFSAADGHDADLALRLAGLNLPGYAFDAEAVEVDITLDPELRPETSRFMLGPIRLGDAEPLIAPLRLEGELNRRGDGYDIGAGLALAAGTALADLTVRYGDDGSARLEAVSKTLTFAPEGLQPGALSPLLAGLQDARGTLTAAATLVWPLDPQAESGRVTLSGVSFAGPATVNGLDLDLVLSRLLPPASPSGQRLTVASLDPGVAIEAVEVVFSLDREPRPQLSIADGGFDLGGGRWHFEPATIDPAAAGNRLVLATEALDLAAFFRLIEVEGLDGSGTLAGRIPVVFAGEDVIVDNGRLEAQGPGRLSIRFEALRSALAGGGETVEMAVKALEDFHYEELSLTLSKTAENDATLRLSTLGQNPAVLEGQPFRFNINLESNLTSVLEALKRGYSLSDDALRRAWRLRQ